MAPEAALSSVFDVERNDFVSHVHMFANERKRVESFSILVEGEY